MNESPDNRNLFAFLLVVDQRGKVKRGRNAGVAEGGGAGGEPGRAGAAAARGFKHGRGTGARRRGWRWRDGWRAGRRPASSLAASDDGPGCELAAWRGAAQRVAAELDGGGAVRAAWLAGKAGTELSARGAPVFVAGRLPRQ